MPEPNRTNEELGKYILLGQITKHITIMHQQLTWKPPAHSRIKASEQAEEALSEILFQLLETLHEKQLRTILNAIQANRGNEKRYRAPQKPPQSSREASLTLHHLQKNKVQHDEDDTATPEDGQV